MRVAFFGSPEFALPSLLGLRSRHDVVLVVTQPDKPAGRGMSSRPPAVAIEARRLDLPLAQPERLRGNGEFLDRFRALDVDVAVTVAYGKILRPELLELPRHGFLNVHASLLPRYRGAGPVQWALINGESETGVSVMQTEVGLDTGPVCLALRTPVDPDERAPELFERLSHLGAEAIVLALATLERGELVCKPQEESQASFAPLLKKEDGDIDWNRSASEIYNRFRGVSAWPGARFSRAGKAVRVVEMRPREGGPRRTPGEVIELGAGVTVAAGSQAIELLQVQPPGKAAMSGRDWANGYRVQLGEILA